MRARVGFVAVALWALATPVVGQSLFGSVGLGLPVDAVDGRARALGNLGLGLSGPALLPTDPAAAARSVLPNGVLVAQPTWAQASSGGETNYFKGTRFPLMAAGYPLFGGVVTLHVTSHMDQDFRGIREIDLTLNGAPAVARDAFDQSGSLSSMNVGYSRRIDDQTSVGVTVGRYTGSVSRTLTRSIVGADSITVQPYLSTGSWTYSGYLVTAGAATRLVDLVDVSASATWSTELDAEASSTTVSGDGSYDLPLQLRLGASAALAPGLALNASVARADWSGVAADLNSGEDAEAVLAFGAGLELTQARLFGRDAPLRLGFRRSGLPFTVGGESASERIFSGGLGLVLAQGGEIVLANLDLGIERGRRTAGPLTENFWRATLSVRASGL